MEMFGYVVDGTDCDFFAYAVSGGTWTVWDDVASAFVTWVDGDYQDYRIAASQLGTSGHRHATAPAGTMFYQLRLRDTLANSAVIKHGWIYDGLFGLPEAASYSEDWQNIQLVVSDMQTVTSDLKRAAKCIAHGTVDAGATTTSIPTKALAPAAIAADQFKGLIMAFPDDTTTTALRGQKTDITASTTGGVFTVTALTTAPAEDDVFVIE